MMRPMSAPEAITLLISLHFHGTAAFVATPGAGWSLRGRPTAAGLRVRVGAVPALRGPAQARGAGKARAARAARLPLGHAPAQASWRPLSMRAFAGETPEFGAGFLGRVASGAVERPVQAVDFTTLNAVSSELQARLPLRVGAVRQAGETDICIALHDPAADLEEKEDAYPGDEAVQRLWMSLSWHRKFGRMSFSATEPLRSSDSGTYALQQEGLARGRTGGEQAGERETRGGWRGVSEGARAWVRGSD
jgi:hypothetical protein